jgi:hypothetical protein
VLPEPVPRELSLAILRRAVSSVAASTDTSAAVSLDWLLTTHDRVRDLGQLGPYETLRSELEDHLRATLQRDEKLILVVRGRWGHEAADRLINYRPGVFEKCGRWWRSIWNRRK